MEPMRKYYVSISVLGNSNSDKEKRLAALVDIERQLNLEFSGEKSLPKRPETSIFSNVSNVENLFWALLTHLKTYNETSDCFLNVLYVACKHLLKKLSVELHFKISIRCSVIAEKAFADKNWSVLEKCFKCFRLFDRKEWNNVLLNEQLRSRIVKVIHSNINVGKEELCINNDRNKQEFAALKILSVEVFSNLIKTEPFKSHDVLKPIEWFMLLFPLLFDESYELRKVAYHTFNALNSSCSDISSRLFTTSPSLKEQLKISYSKILVQFVRTNEPDWVNLWCLMIELLGSEFSSRKNTELINNLLEAEETGFRSPNMNTRYHAFVGWKFLVNKFLDTSLEDASRRLKLLMQPLIASNSKTLELTTIKFEVWWQLLVGIEPCIEKHATTILNNFLNFCFGPVGDANIINNMRVNSDVPSTTKLASRRPATSSSTMYPLITVRRMKGLDVDRADALAQILNWSNESKSEYKLQNFKSTIISKSQTFLSLSKMIIHCVGECTVLLVESKEVSLQERKFYLGDIWRNLLMHIRKIDRSSSGANDGRDASDKQEKTEMIKNVFRILLRLNEMGLDNQDLACVCLNPVLEIILSSDYGLPDEVLISRTYYVGMDLLTGTPLLIFLDIFLSPACLNIQFQDEKQKIQNNILYMILLQRILKLGIGPSDFTVNFTQAVVKRIDSIACNISIDGSKIKSIWATVAKLLTSSYVGLGRDINQGTENKADFTCLMTLLMFPVNYSKFFLTDQDTILNIWGKLFQAFQKNVCSNVSSVVGNEICNALCGKILQEITRKKDIQCEELFHIMCLIKCAIEQIPFRSVNKIVSKSNNEGEKLSHFVQCFQLLQTLSVEIQKLKQEDKVYIKIVTQYATSFKILCDNLQQCPVQFLTQFFIEQVQFLLSIKITNNDSAASKAFSTTCFKTWNSFLNVLLSGSLRLLTNENKQKIIKLVHPALLASFNHSDHFIHEITINFMLSEKTVIQTNDKCSKCRIMQERKDHGQSPSTSCRSPAESGSGKRKELSRPLTQHQRESLKQRKDDIPALYQDLTQDSQPSFSDSQDIFIVYQSPPNKNIASSSNRISSFQSGDKLSTPSKDSLSTPSKVYSTNGSPSFDSALKILTHSEDNDQHVNRSSTVKNCKLNVEQKLKDKHLEAKPPSECAADNFSEVKAVQNKSEKKVNDMSRQKTILVIKRSTNNVFNSSTTNISRLPSLKHHGSEVKQIQCILSLNDSNLKGNKSLKDSSPPLRMCISKLKTGNPEVKSIITDFSSVDEDSDKKIEQASTTNCTDLPIQRNVESSTILRYKKPERPSCPVKDGSLQSVENISKSSESISDKSLKNSNISIGVEKKCELVSQKEKSNINLVQSVNDFKEQTKSVKNNENPIIIPISKDVHVSPSKVVSEKLNVEAARNSSVQVLQLADNKFPEKAETFQKKEESEELCSELCNAKNKSATVEEVKSDAFSAESLQDVLRFKECELKQSLEIGSKEECVLDTNSHPDRKTKSISSLHGNSEAQSGEGIQTRSKAPQAQHYPTKSKPITAFFTTRTYEKKNSIRSDQKLDMIENNSSKKSVKALKDSSKSKDLESTDQVNKSQLNIFVSDQNSQNRFTTSNESESLTVVKRPSVANTEMNESKEKEISLPQGECLGTRNLDSADKIIPTKSDYPEVIDCIDDSDKTFVQESCPGKVGNTSNQKRNCEDHGDASEQKVMESVKETCPSLKTTEHQANVPLSERINHIEQLKDEHPSEVYLGPVLEMDIGEKNKQELSTCTLPRDSVANDKINDVTSEISETVQINSNKFSTQGSIDIKQKEVAVVETKCSLNDSSEILEKGSSPSDTLCIENVSQVNVVTLHTETSDLQQSILEQRNDKDEDGVFGTNKVSSNSEIPSQISCDKGEYVRQLSLMPQNASIEISPKTHRISTRSDWARRFGGKFTSQTTKNMGDGRSERDNEENCDLDSASDVTGSIDSLDYQDIIESSQGIKKEITFKTCILRMRKICIVPGTILTGVGGDFLVTEEISSGLYKLVKRTSEKEKEQECTLQNSRVCEDTEKSSGCVDKTLVRMERPEKCEEQEEKAEGEDEIPLIIVKKSLTKAEHHTSLMDSTNNTENSGRVDETCQLSNNAEEKVSEACSGNLKTETDQKIVDVSPKNENLNIKESCIESDSNNSEGLLLENIPGSEESITNKKRKRENFEAHDMNPKRKRELNDPCIDELDNLETETHAYQPTEGTSETESRLQSDELDESSPIKVPLSVPFPLNISPPKPKIFKPFTKSEESSPNYKLLSGRAAQMVGLALTKEPETRELNISPPSTGRGMGELGHDVVITIHDNGQEEKSPWIRHEPECKAPGKTNLKRKHPDTEESSETTSKKIVRFSSPEVTKKLHFHKRNQTEYHTEPAKELYQIIRYKNGKIIVQKSHSPTRTKKNKVLTSEPSETNPAWPPLVDCKSPITHEVIEQLTITPESLDELTSALTTKKVFTIGDLCSLSEEDVKELPIKAPKTVMFKLVMQEFEDKMKNTYLNNVDVQQQAIKAGDTDIDAKGDLKTLLSSMDPAAVIELLKESLSESDMKKVANNISMSSSVSVGVATEYETQDATSLTDDDASSHAKFFLDKALNKDMEQKEKSNLIQEVVKNLCNNSNLPHVLKEFHHVISDLNFEVANRCESEQEESMIQCFKLLHFFSSKSALPRDCVRDVIEDAVRQIGVHSVMSDILKCNDIDKQSSNFQQNVLDCVLVNSSMNLKKVLESVAKRYATDENESMWMNIFLKSMQIGDITKRKHMLNIFNGALGLSGDL